MKLATRQDRFETPARAFGTGRSRALVLTLTAACALSYWVPRQAAARAGELSVVGQLGGSWPPGGGVALLGVDIGLNDWFEVRPAAGYELTAAGSAGLLQGELKAMYDVLAWVPEAFVGGGIVYGRGPIRARVYGGARVRYYIALAWAIEGGVAVEWRPTGVRGVATAGLRWSLL